MDITARNHITIQGQGPQSILFSHGFGCDQSMWRFVEPAFREQYRTVLYDLVGSGRSDLSAYDSKKYSTLEGYADDLLEVVEATAESPVFFVGHSVSASIGLIASIKAPEKFAAHVMVGPSPCYTNQEDYVGGFSEADIQELCDTLDSNYLGWSSTMAPKIMGAPELPELSEELTNSFCRTDPKVAKEFARATFTADDRHRLSLCHTPTLILQSSDDFIASQCVGEYVQRSMPNSIITIINNTGHCPHMSEPEQCISAMKQFLHNLSSHSES